MDLQKCHGHDCEKLVFENYYCPECFNELQTKQKEKRPKQNYAKLIRENIFNLEQMRSFTIFVNCL